MEFRSVPAELLRALLREISGGDQPPTVSFSGVLSRFGHSEGGQGAGGQQPPAALQREAPRYLPQVLPHGFAVSYGQKACGAGNGKASALRKHLGRQCWS